MSEEQAGNFTFALNTKVNDTGRPDEEGGQGVIRTRDFCLAKAAIYRSDLLARYNSGISPDLSLEYKDSHSPNRIQIHPTATSIYRIPAIRQA